MGGTNKARAGVAFTAPSQRRRRRQRKRQGGGGGREGGRIFLMQRKVGKSGRYGKDDGMDLRAALVYSRRVQNMGCVAYKKVNEQGRLHITVTKKGKEKKRVGG